MIIAGDIFGGQTATAALAVQFVQQQKAIGADFVKANGGNPESIFAIYAEAKNQGLSVAGHLPTPGVSAPDASNAGLRAMEHLGAGWGFMLDCSTDDVNIRQAALIGAAKPPFPQTFAGDPRLYDGAQNAQFYQRIFDTYNDAKCQALAQTFAKNGTWHVPTLIKLRQQTFSDAQLYRTDPNLIYVDKTRRATWEQMAQQGTTSMPPTAAASLQQYYGLYQKATKLLKQNGVKMLAGSDVCSICVWAVPGFDLHQEFRELAAAGLSPLEILQMTTLNGAEFLNRQATMGTVDVGKNADLVLLDADPIADVANLDKISGVFLKGKYFPKAALDKLKSDVAAAYAVQSIQALSTILDPAHVD